MQAIRSIETVGENGRLELHLNKLAGSRVEVIVLDLEEVLPSTELGGEAMALAKLPETTGFASMVLASAAEDVWNDL